MKAVVSSGFVQRFVFQELRKMRALTLHCIYVSDAAAVTAGYDQQVFYDAD